VTDKQRQTRPRSSAGSRPPLPKFSGYVEVDAHYIFHPSTIWVRPLCTELGPKKTLQNADFAMKQTNICRLSGDITRMVQLPATAAIEYVAAVNACLIYIISSV